MTNRTNHQPPLYFKVVLGGSFVVIVFMLFALARSTYRDLFQVGTYIDSSTAFIEQQKNDLVAKPEELEYVNSARYQEKIAKEFLGLKLSGEEVIVLADGEQSVEDFLPDRVRQNKNLELLTPPQKWWRYIFGI